MVRRTIVLLALLSVGMLAVAAPGRPTDSAVAPTGEVEAVEAAVAGAIQGIDALPAEDRARALRLLEDRAAAATKSGRHWLLALFNMTSWVELPWFLLGVAGQLAFFLRMFIQWLASERRRESVVPPVFWWLSLGGSALLMTYGVWRKDIVIILGQSLGVMIYARNLWFIHSRSVKAAAARSAPRPPRTATEDRTPEIVIAAPASAPRETLQT